ncbi:hypothetical protein HYW94_02775 [Candidatus Uhrbacteria bacterium]|nr:hypothetical protein [Candidatus Uhrbacteria bacterium]
MSGTDPFYQIKPNTDQISYADIIYLEFGIPILHKLRESLDEKIIFQSILHGITRGHSHTPYRAGVLCGTALVLAYTRGVLTRKDLPYLEGEGLWEFKDELERHKQEFISRVAAELLLIFMPLTLWERILGGMGIVRKGQKKKIYDLTQEINTLLAQWG